MSTLNSKAGSKTDEAKKMAFRAFLDEMRQTSDALDPVRKAAYFAWRDSLHKARRSCGLAVMFETPTLVLPEIDTVKVSALVAKRVPVSATASTLNILELPLSCFQGGNSDIEYRLGDVTRRAVNLTGRLPRERPYVFDLLQTKRLSAGTDGRYVATRTDSHLDIHVFEGDRSPRLAYRLTLKEYQQIEDAFFNLRLKKGDPLILFSKRAKVGAVSTDARGQVKRQPLPAYTGDIEDPGLTLSQAAASVFAVNSPDDAKPAGHVLPYVCGVVDVAPFRRTKSTAQSALQLCCAEVAEGTPQVMLSPAAIKSVLNAMRSGHLVFNSPYSGVVEACDWDYSDQYVAMTISGQTVHVPAQCASELPSVGSQVAVGQPLYHWSAYHRDNYQGDDNELLFELSDNFVIAHLQTLLLWHKRICRQNELAWHLQPGLIVPSPLLGNVKPSRYVLDFSRTLPYLRHAVGGRHVTCDLLDYETNQTGLSLQLVGL